MAKTHQHYLEKIYHGRSYAYTEDATDSGDYWASFFIPPGYTAALNNTLYGNYSTFTRSITYFYDEGRSVLSFHYPWRALMCP